MSSFLLLPGSYFHYSRPTNSTSNTSAELGGMTRPAPCEPYAMEEGMIRVRLPPTFIPITPWSHPLITRPAPSRNEK